MTFVTCAMHSSSTGNERVTLLLRSAVFVQGLPRACSKPLPQQMTQLASPSQPLNLSSWVRNSSCCLPYALLTALVCRPPMHVAVTKSQICLESWASSLGTLRRRETACGRARQRSMQSAGGVIACTYPVCAYMGVTDRRR
jgi:hypothetical protein